MKTVWPIVKLVFKEIFRKKDFYTAFILIIVILSYVSQIRVYNISHIVRYVREVGLALVFLFSVMLTLPLAARQFPNEQRERTLAVLLAKPVSRGAFVLGKFLGVFLAGAACFLVFYAVFAAVVMTRASVAPFAAA